jgi:hypothetical protein
VRLTIEVMTWPHEMRLFRPPLIYRNIYSLYIKSPELLIMRENSGQTIQSGRVRLDPDVYKTRSRVIGFSFFHAPSRFISDDTCDDGGCPKALAAVDPRSVATVATAP